MFGLQSFDGGGLLFFIFIFFLCMFNVAFAIHSTNILLERQTLTKTNEKNAILVRNDILYTGKFSRRCTENRYGLCLPPYIGIMKEGLRRQDSLPNTHIYSALVISMLMKSLLNVYTLLYILGSRFRIAEA